MVEQVLNAIAFPKLSEQEIGEIQSCSKTTLECYADGRALFDVGDRDPRFFIVKSGAVTILDVSGSTPKTITVHGPGEFTGDVAHLTGRPAIVRAVAQGPTEVYAV